MSKLLNPGDKVFIKNKEDILSSLDENGMSKNGIKFYEDMEECCGSDLDEIYRRYFEKGEDKGDGQHDQKKSRRLFAFRKNQ